MKNIIEGEFATNLFQKKEIRKTFHNNEWWFSVIDLIDALCEYNDSEKAKKYWFTTKTRLEQVGSELSTFCRQLKIPSKKDGKSYPTDCINVAGILRLIQEIPTKKAEPFKKWLAKTGFERIQEQQNPDLITQRMMLTYQLQGRDERWIRNRIDGAITRKELTTEWKNRDVKEGQEFATLTNTKKGARNAGIAREAYENASGRKVVSCENFINNIKQAQLDLPENDKPEDIIAPFTREFKRKK